MGALAELMRTLEDRREVGKLHLFQRLLSDAASPVLSLLVLLVAAYLWLPHSDSRKYSYNVQPDMDKEGGARESSSVWVDDEDDVGWGDDWGDDGDSFWTTSAKPNVVGASDSK